MKDISVIKALLHDNLIEYGKTFLNMAKDVAIDSVNEESHVDIHEHVNNIQVATDETIELILYIVEHGETP